MFFVILLHSFITEKKIRKHYYLADIYLAFGFCADKKAVTIGGLWSVPTALIHLLNSC